jgi:opacity protein-like surface antigen
MKNLKFTLMALLMLSVSGIMAQMSVGIKGGINFGDLHVQGISDEILPNIRAISGPTVGITFEREFSQNFSMLSEVNYVQKGFVIDEGIGVNILGMDVPIGVRAETRFNYFEVPLLAKYKIGNEQFAAYVVAGPSASYASSAYIQPKATVLIDFNLPRIDLDLSDDMYSQWDFSGVVGAGVEYNTGGGKVFGDLRYSHSFSNVLNDPVIDIKLKNKGFSLGIGYAMSF